VSEKVAAGQAWPLVVEEDDQLVAVGVYDIINGKKGNDYLNIWAMGGERMNEWLEDVLALIERRAKAWQYDGVMLGGRAGWRRQLEKYGYEFEAVILKKVV
jgi:hypothetical protein